MASLTIRNIEEDTKERLRVRAAQNGRSMEEEARVILRTTVAGASGADLWKRSRALFAGAEGVDLEAPPRTVDRAAPDFDDGA
jgi:plasmid stability protein